MSRFLLPLAFILLVCSSAASSENVKNPGKIWGWLKIRAQEKYGIMEDIMSGLAGSHYYIHYVHVSGISEPVPVFSLSPGGMRLVKDIVTGKRDFRPGDRDGKYTVIHFVLQGYEDSIFLVIRILSMGGYFEYALAHIDDFSLVGDFLRCPLRKAQCLGESMCNFIKTAALSFPVHPSADAEKFGPFELASLLVHEAAHLERCYDDEEYACYQEERFKSALFARMRNNLDDGGEAPRALTARLLTKSRVHVDTRLTEPTPLENFTPPYIIEPRIIGAAHRFRYMGGSGGSLSSRTRVVHADQSPSLKTVIGQAL